MDKLRIADLTVEEFRAIIREELSRIQTHALAVDQTQSVDDLSDFPVDDVGPWPDNFTLSREELYGDDGR